MTAAVRMTAFVRMTIVPILAKITDPPSFQCVYVIFIEIFATIDNSARPRS